MPHIIHTDQKGCIENRYIGHNIRLVQDVINEQDEDRLILLLDQQKAFDRVEWNWRFSVLEKFNFGQRFIKWIKTMYNGMKSAILTNGYLSPYFSISRGIRQGDSLSALLYIIQAEPLVTYIRKDPNFKGVNVKDENEVSTEVKCCQYVDDTVFLLDDQNSVALWINVIEEFGVASGSKLNKNKTIGLSMKNRDHGEGLNIKFTTDSEKLLGIPVGFRVNGDEHWKRLIKKMSSKIAPWRKRNLSYSGKIHILKSIGLSQLLYSVEMMEIDNKYITEVENIIWDFIWEGRRCFVKPEVCMLPRHKGGLGIPSFKALVQVRRIKMVIDLLKQQGPWCTLALGHLRCLDDRYSIPYFAIQSDDNDKEVDQTSIPKFYKECISAFQELCRKGKVVSTPNT